MIDKHLHIFLPVIKVIVAALWVVALGACASDGDDVRPVPGNNGHLPVPAEYQAGFFITVSDGAAPVQGRATPEGDYDYGQGWENHIDLDNRNIHVVVLDGSGKFERELTDFEIVEYDSSAGKKTYHVVASVTSDKPWPKPFKIVVMANWPTVPDLSKGVSELWNASYGFTSPELSATNLIPLYGVKDCSATLVANKYADLGIVHLIRAMAKVEVELNQSDDYGHEWEFASLQLSRYNRSGLCAPTGVLAEDAYVHGNYDEDYVASPSLPTGVETGENLDFVEVSKGKWVVYVPEYSNTAAGSVAARIKVVFKNSFNSSADNPEYIDFKYYDKPGQPAFDILRNYYYRYSVSKLSESQTLGVEVHVKPYGEVSLRPGFGL